MIVYDMPWWIVATYVFALGAVVGSFLNVCVHRLPMHTGYWKPIQGLWTPPSRCPKCMTAIRKTDNFPIFGWLRLRGRCRSCGLKISWRYPAIELFNGLMVVALYFLNVPIERWSDLSDSFLTTPLGPFASDTLLSEFWLVHARFLTHWLLCELLLVAALIDLDLTIIPAVVTDPWILVGVAISAVGGIWLWPIDYDLPFGIAEVALMQNAIETGSPPLRPEWVNLYPVAHGIAASVAGAATGFLSVWSIRWVGTKIIGIEAVGAGDVWLMAMVGSFLGWQPTIIAMFLSLFFALGTIFLRLAAGRFEPIPYGPYLSLGSVTTLMGWHEIWPKAAQIFDLGPFFLAALGVVMLILLAVILWIVQLVKRALGIEMYNDDPVLTWRSADQSMYQAGERPSETVGQWTRPHQWTGTLSGRGQQFGQDWRR